MDRFLQGDSGEDAQLLDRALEDRQVLMAPVVLTESRIKFKTLKSQYWRYRMMVSLRTRLSMAISACTLGLTLVAIPASASTISWTTWSSGVASPTAGSASGTIAGLGGLTVGYSGEMESLINLIWNFPATFIGGTVSNTPPTGTNDAIQLFGGGSVVDTITFGAPVVNPILDIISLGQGGITANFTFPASYSFTIEAGGPSQFGGSSIVTGIGCPSNAVCGTEGSGVVQFNGTFSTLTWRNPVGEDYYGFTVGATSLADGAVPEPASLLFVGTGLVAAGARRWRTSRGRG